MLILYVNPLYHDIIIYISQSFNLARCKYRRPEKHMFVYERDP